MKQLKKIQIETGFTIVELMIATIVFSTILIVITLGVVTFSNQYYKGVNASATQNTTRSIIDAVSQAIQFSAADVVSTTDTSGNFFCAGGYVFSYAQSLKYDGTGATTTNPGFYMQPMGTDCSTAPTTFNDGEQLLGENQRITEIYVGQAGSTSLYTIKVGVAFGDNDLFCSTDTNTPIDSGRCNGTGELTNANIWSIGADALSCKSGDGSAFCATSVLITTVQKRL